MEEQLLDFFKERYKKTGGNCGTRLPELTNGLGLDYQKIRPFLNKFYKEEIITIRDGIHGQLIFINPKIMKDGK